MKDNFYFRYCGLYLLSYVGLTLAIFAIAYFAAWAPPSAINIVIAMVSTYHPAYQFVKDNGRVPEKSEKRRFAGATLAVITVLSFVLMAGMTLIVPGLREHLSAVVQELNVIFAGIVVIALLIYYGVIVFGFGQSAKMQLKAIEKARAKGTL